jgi:hypothetical protein
VPPWKELLPAPPPWLLNTDGCPHGRAVPQYSADPVTAPPPACLVADLRRWPGPPASPPLTTPLSNSHIAASQRFPLAPCSLPVKLGIRPQAVRPRAGSWT